MTAQALINLALQTIGVISSGESPSNEESNDGLTALNSLIASWSAQLGPIPTISQVEVPLTGAASYNLATRALKVESAAVVNDGLTTPYAVVKKDIWAAGDLNRVLWYDGGYPTGAIRLRPSPSAGTLELYNYVELTALATLATSVAFPPGYDRALRYGLAVDLAPEFGRPLDQGLIGLANDAKMSIQGLNQAVLGSDAAAAAG